MSPECKFGVLPPEPPFRSSRSTHPLLGWRDVSLPFTLRGWPRKPVRASPLQLSGDIIPVNVINFRRIN